MADVDPDLDAALRRLRAAFGFVEVLRVIDHQAEQDATRDEEAEASPDGERDGQGGGSGGCNPPA
jgi:hypothetical protein